MPSASVPSRTSPRRRNSRRGPDPAGGAAGRRGASIADDRAGGSWARIVARRYRPGWSGSLYLATTLFLAIGAINSQNNLLFVAFGLAIAGVLVSGFVSGPGLMGLRVRRLSLGEARVDMAMSIRYRVRNANRLVPAFAITIEDLPGHTRRSRSDLEDRLAIGPAFIEQVRAGRSRTIEAQCVPLRRGEARLGAIRASSTFPFGLMRKSVLFTQDDRVVVLPARVPLREGVRARVRAAAESGTQVSTRIGNGDDFFGVREYVPGDAPRQIAWRASARVGNLLVRQTSAPAPRRVWIVVDLRSSDREPWSVELAIALAGELARTMLEDGYAVALAVPGFGVLIAPGQGRRHGAQIERALAGIDADRPGVGHADLPRRSLMRETFVVVHAGSPDLSIGPGGAVRLSALDPGAMVLEPDALNPSMRPGGPRKSSGRPISNGKPAAERERRDASA